MASEPVEEMPYTEQPSPQQPTTPAQQEQLTPKFRDMGGFSIDFKLKPVTKLGKAMDAFSARLQKDTKELRFLSEGRRVLPDQTPLSLELEDGDEIDVHMEQIGGHMI
ncbi:hypothetical protein D0860_05926 [Hortaea werneckii]|uniref:Ubiquitin-like domain-containing protein n=1 Tax=Hortaea werneckii TaxID=91943 RepID=A0A3M7GWP8_HORWE|nr:hypothetical protein D0860_05926 [Hortaea werneckii]